MAQQVNEEFGNRVARVLQAKLGNSPTCPMCKRQVMMNISPQLYTFPSIMPEENRIDLGSTFPVVVTSCTHCGHVMLFSAIQLGLIP